MPVNVARPLSNKLVTNFRYASYISLNPSGLATAVHVFSANGLYDPDITGVGHQPSGFDQVMALYDHYVVLKSTINFQIINLDTTYPITVGIASFDNSTPLADYRAYIESGRSTWQGLSPSAGSADKGNMKQTMLISDFMGRTNVESEDDLAGSASANPFDQAYWHVWADGHTVDTAACYGIAVIDYFAILREPVNAGLS